MMLQLHSETISNTAVLLTSHLLFRKRQLIYPNKHKEENVLMPAQQHEKIFFRLTPKSLSPTYNKSRIFPLTQSRNEFQVKVLILYSMNLCAQGQYLKKSLKQEDNKHHIFQFHMENNSLGKMLKTDDEETSRG